LLVCNSISYVFFMNRLAWNVYNDDDDDDDDDMMTMKALCKRKIAIHGAVLAFTGPFADKPQPTCGQSSRGLVNLPTANFFNHGNTALYVHAKLKPNTNPDPIDYCKCSVE